MEFKRKYSIIYLFKCTLNIYSIFKPSLPWASALYVFLCSYGPVRWNYLGYIGRDGYKPHFPGFMCSIYIKSTIFVPKYMNRISPGKEDYFIVVIVIVIVIIYYELAIAVRCCYHGKW